MKEKLISLEEVRKIHPLFQSKFVSKCAMKIAGLNIANKIYDAGKHCTGPDIEDALLNSIGIIRKIHNIDVIKQFEKMPFITVSNHPYGHIDGIAIIGEISKLRPDYKVMVNWILNMIDIMREHFIAVNPYGKDVVDKSSLSGVKESIQHLKNGKPLGFFPAGAVSFPKCKGEIEDREWQDVVIRIIQKAQVPVIPVYISGQNSKFFYWLAKISWQIRTLRLCHELNNKKGKTVDLVFGEPIMPEEIAEYTDIKDLGQFLKNRTYQLAANIR